MNFTFSNPTKLIFGEGAIAKLGDEVIEKGVQKVLLLAGGGSIKKNGVYAQVMASLREKNIIVVECWGIRSNPELAKVYEAIQIAREEAVEAVLAVGGGSVIDTAKAVAAGVYLNDIWQAFEWKVAIQKALPIFTVLTLSATASEMNGNAVITKAEAKSKWGIGSPRLYPQVSIVDPGIQCSLPWKQTVSGAVDVLAHIMEYYCMGNEEETSLAIDEALMKTVIAMVDKLQKDPEHTVSRANLAWAATLGLNGISGAGLRGGDWACHMMEHSVSAFYPQISHGDGLGIIIPAWMQYVQKTNPKQFTRFARNVWNCNSVEKAIVAWQEKLVQWGSATRLRDLGVAETQLEPMSANAVSNGPIGKLQRLEKDDVARILHLAY
ncbi:iron-containing alcohol dehydrogenase [Anaeromusa sp.]|uniref:iron-containing alcohol dehydrogenase n=1 Tax=Anaeromusa sp. TaxID=1872520 RepID=UPI0026085E1F|nr:iron-containing alcohol dehydrogenase [Anaeromusa sp.]MDD3158017.1 iron-containing alcohol dehydrogenase [Anaeromusa sp.]